jgi:hypothetical protein
MLHELIQFKDLSLLIIAFLTFLSLFFLMRAIYWFWLIRTTPPAASKQQLNNIGGYKQPPTLLPF